MKNTLSPKNEAKSENPNLPPRLFWEFIYEKMKWQTGYETVIERVLDRGNDHEIEELIRFYGWDKVLMVLKDRPIYLMDHCIERACKLFGINKEDTVCYKRKVERGHGWL
ncbi:DUF6922 domain-containing protein [Puia dinghuensis]|uniref:DUF6922 domain-containing protein n=1 Tax=Puia dinghuensis TaxID=1792502 RepID=A0A8J2XVY3_9BACT|nr:hypothetical protein [Puia dinghuensis]GGB20051.1 hypothetical protein GCM10011511_49710 [Puia dinghuensis]